MLNKTIVPAFGKGKRLSILQKEKHIVWRNEVGNFFIILNPEKKNRKIMIPLTENQSRWNVMFYYFRKYL